MKTKPCRPTGARLGALLLVAFAMSLVPLASATHVPPQFVPGPTNHTCADFAAEGETWVELKVDPARDGTYTSADGELTVTVDVNGAGKVFSWTANASIVHAVFVKAGSAGHNLYVYDPPASGDTGLTTPGSGNSNQISHISFCFMVAPDVPPTCEDFPDMPECQPTCEDFPDMPECQPTCEDFPDMPECQPTCEDFPDMPECQPTCEDFPDMPECQVPCPATLTATPNADGSITLDVNATGASQLFRKEAGGDFVLIASLTGSAVHVDSTTTVGTAYTYQLVVAGEVCGTVEVSSIPNFPTMVGTVAAVGLGAVGYAFMRRRK